MSENRMASGPAQLHSSVSHATESARPWKVLLIEDRPDQHRRLLHILRQARADVTLECNIKSGFDLVNSRPRNSAPFDLVITDLRVPYPDAVEFARKLRLNGMMSPIVMISGQSDPVLEERALDAGCDFILSRSTSDDEIIARLQGIVQLCE